MWRPKAQRRSVVASTPPTLAVELALAAAGARWVIGIDEVGRGALAGPVAVGAALWHAGLDAPPARLRDSKLLAEPVRERLAPELAGWAAGSAVGMASAAEIDALGIVACLGLAAVRALAALPEPPGGWSAAVALLDGVHDWLTPALRRADAPAGAALAALMVRTRAKADRDCASVAAASVLAKTERDRLLRRLDAEQPGYGWASNKGYGSAAHFTAIAALGPSAEHRRSWLRQPATLG